MKYIYLIIAALAVVSCAQNPSVTQMSLDEALKYLAEASNKALPTPVDRETRLDNLKASADTLTYNYTLINIESNRVNKEQFRGN